MTNLKKNYNNPRILIYKLLRFIGLGITFKKPSNTSPDRPMRFPYQNCSGFPFSLHNLLLRCIITNIMDIGTIIIQTTSVVLNDACVKCLPIN